MENYKQVSRLLLIFLVVLFAISHLARVESKCVKRNFQYPTPANKPDTLGSSHAEQISPSSSSSSSSSTSSSSSKEEKEEEKKEQKEKESSSSSEQKSTTASGSVSGSASSGAVESPDGDAEANKYKFGDMLKQVVGHSDPNFPILNIPKATVDDPDIVKFCKTTDYPDICESTVAHFVDGRHDAEAMLEMVIKACVQYTQLARATAKKLALSPIFAKIKARFADIDEYYVDALDNLQDAENALKAKDKGTVNINLSAALDDYSAYEDDWGETSPMADFDAKLTHMASNCLAIATLVKFK